MNPYLVLREDIRSSWVGFLAFTLMIGITLSFTVAVISVERAFQQASKEAAAPFSLLAVPPGNKYAQLMQFAYLKPSQMELLPAEIVSDLLSQNKNALYVTPLGFGDNHLGNPVVGVTPAFIDQAGKLSFAAGERFKHPFEAVVGARVAMKVGDSFTPGHGRGDDLGEFEAKLSGKGEDGHHINDFQADEEGHHEHDVKYTVTGKLAMRGNIWDFAILVPIETVWKLHGMMYGHKPHGDFHELVVGPPFDPEYISPAPAVVYGFAKKQLASASKIRFLYNGKKEVDLFAPAEVLLDIYKYLGDGKKLLLIVACGSIVIVLVSIFFSIIASLDTYAPKLMLLRVLGARRLFVFFTVWLKSVIMTGCGAVFGLVGGIFAAKIMATSLSSSTYLFLKPTLGLSEFYVVIALFVASVFGATIPALLITRRSPAEVLRGN